MHTLSYIYTLNADPSGFKYHLFYQLAILASFLIFLYYGYRKKYPLARWLLLCLTVSFFATLGSKLGTYGVADWQQVWQEGALLTNTNRTSIGAFVLGLIGMWGAIRILQLAKGALDVYAYSIPIIVIFHRIGCLLAGCCFGVPTNGEWGLQYSGVSWIRDHHINSALADKYELTSCVVHPVPVYFILGAVLTLLLVYALRKRIKASGNLMLLSIAILLFTRFFIEFFRDGISNHQLGDFYFGMKGVQWAVAVMSVLLFGIVAWRERKWKPVVLKTKRRTISFVETVCYTTIFTLLILLVKDLFTAVEIGALHVKVVLIWLALAYALVSQLQISRLRWQTGLLVILSFVFMSQAYPDTISEMSGRKKISFELSYNEMDTKEIKYDCLQTDEGCGGTYCAVNDTLHPYGPKYFNGRASVDVINYYAYNHKQGDRYSRYGLEYQPEYFYNPELDFLEKKYSWMPYFGFGNTRRYETRFGLRFGEMFGNEFSSIDNIKKYKIAFYQRLGNMEKFYVDFGISNAPDIGPSASSGSFLVNYNFGTIESGPLEEVSLGLSNLYGQNAFHFESTFLLNNHWIVSPRFGVLGLSSEKAERPHFYFGFTGGYQFITKGQ